MLESDQCGGILNIMKVNTIQVGPKGIKIDQQLRQIVQTATLNEDLEANEYNDIQINIRAIFNKNNCFDIFKNTKLNGEHIYEPMLNRQRL